MAVKDRNSTERNIMETKEATTRRIARREEKMRQAEADSYWLDQRYDALLHEKLTKGINNAT